MKTEVTRVKYDGGVCLAPMKRAFDPYSTWCGSCDEYDMELIPTNDPLTCQACKATFEAVRNGVKIVKV